jgi:hypothetical protein
MLSFAEVSTSARALLLAALATGALVSSRAAAETADERAMEAYNQGVRLHKRHEYARAAEAFARADEIVPSAVALSAALEAAVLADAPVLGMELVDRAQQRPADAGLNKRVESARARFGPRVGQLNVSCERAKSCLATVDGAAINTGRDTWVLAGRRMIVAQIDDETQQRLLDVPAGDTAKVVFAPKPSPAPPPPPVKPIATAAPSPTPSPTPAPASRGLPPAVFFVSAGLTLIGGGLTTVSALDTHAKRDDFRTKGCEAERLPGCVTLATDGSNARDRTNVALAVTAALGVTSVIIGAFFVRWHKGPDAPATGLVIGPGRADVVGTF